MSSVIGMCALAFKGPGGLLCTIYSGHSTPYVPSNNVTVSSVHVWMYSNVLAAQSLSLKHMSQQPKCHSNDCLPPLKKWQGQSGSHGCGCRGWAQAASCLEGCRVSPKPWCSQVWGVGASQACARTAHQARYRLLPAISLMPYTLAWLEQSLLKMLPLRCWHTLERASSVLAMHCCTGCREPGMAWLLGTRGVFSMTPDCTQDGN